MGIHRKSCPSTQPTQLSFRGPPFREASGGCTHAGFGGVQASGREATIVLSQLSPPRQFSRGLSRVSAYCPMHIPLAFLAKPGRWQPFRDTPPGMAASSPQYLLPCTPGPVSRLDLPSLWSPPTPALCPSQSVSFPGSLSLLQPLAHYLGVREHGNMLLNCPPCSLVPCFSPFSLCVVGIRPGPGHPSLLGLLLVRGFLLPGQPVASLQAQGQPSE